VIDALPAFVEELELDMTAGMKMARRWSTMVAAVSVGLYCFNPYLDDGTTVVCVGRVGDFFMSP
jgi:hypothetical protein